MNEKEAEDCPKKHIIASSSTTYLHPTYLSTSSAAEPIFNDQKLWSELTKVGIFLEACNGLKLRPEAHWWPPVNTYNAS